MERILTEALYRIDCPEAQELGEYHFGILGGNRRAAIAAHLADCPHCSREIAQLRSYLSELNNDLEYTPAERLRIWIGRLAPQPSGGGLQPALAVRGEEQPPLVYEAGDAQIILESAAASEPERKTLVGLVLGAEPAGFGVGLWPAGGDTIPEAPLASTTVDDLGNFVLENIPPGEYEIVIAGDDTEYRLPSVTVT